MFTSKETKAINSYIVSLPGVPDAQLTPDVIIKWDKVKTTKTSWGGKQVDKTPVFYYPKAGVVNFLDNRPSNYKNDYLYDDIEDMRHHPFYSNNKDSVTSAKPDLYSYYGRYHKEIDALEIASVHMSGKRAKDGEVRAWEYADINNERYFLFRNGEAFKGFSYLKKDCKFYNSVLLHWLQSDIHQNIHNRYFDKQTIIFFGHRAVDWSQKEIYWIPYRVREWYEKVAERPVKKDSVKDHLIHSNDLPEYSSQYLFTTGKGFDKIGVCVPYEDGVLVRYYSNRRYFDNYDYLEDYRAFFNEKEQFILKATHDAWTPCAVNNCYMDCSYDALLGKENLSRVKRVKRVLPVITDWNFQKNMFVQNLVIILKNPIVEKIYKAGYYNLTKRMMNNGVSVYLKDCFSTTSKKTGSIYSNLGMNKIQLKIIERIAENNSIPQVKFLKEIGGEDLVHWEEKKSEKLFNFAVKAKSWAVLALRETNVGAPCYIRWGERNVFVPTDEDKKNIRNLINLSTKHPETDVVQLFRDTVMTMCDQVYEILPNMNPFEAKTLRELEWMHDQYVEIANAKRYNKLTKDGRWDKFNKKRIEMYERIGDEFEIIVPKEPKDIINEGASLSHCVGGYLNSVASGYKTILFLRKVSEPDKSFYTIEVNESKVIQIHGLHNRWLGNNPEAIQFVIDWLKDVKVTCPLRILFNLGQGYAGSGKLLDHSNYKLNEYVEA